MGAAATTFIPKVFREHLETVGFVWQRRQRGLRSAGYTGIDLAAVDDLIEAHLEGLAAAGEEALPELVEELLGDNPLGAFAGASALLRVGTMDALEAVTGELTNANGAKLDALCDALSYGPSTPLRAQLTSLFDSGPPNVAAAAGVILAFHGGFTPSPMQLEPFLVFDDAAVRTKAWRIAVYSKTPIATEAVERGLRDEDPDARRAAFEAAAWNASPAFYPYCRELSAHPTPESIDALVLLAAVAPPQAYQLIEAIGANAAAGPGRFRVVGAFGHPYFIAFLVRQLEQAEPADAVAAGAAFAKMTGRSLRAPDANLAQRTWGELAPSLAQSARICRGFDVTRPLDRDAFAQLDRESAWEFCLRARLTAGWDGTPLTLERFPQRV